MMRIILLLMVLLGAATGCGSEGNGQAAPVDVEQETAVESVEELEQRLTEVKEYGEGGSALAGIRTSIENIRSSHPDKAEALMRDMDALERAQSPEQIKKIAQSMLDRL